jgi:plastocyanin
MTEEAPPPDQPDQRRWRMLEAIGLGAVGLSLFAIMIIAREVIPPVIVFGVVYLALGYAVYRWIDRPRVALAAAILGLLGLLANLPFILSDLSHIDTWAAFAPNIFATLLGVTGIAAGFISFFRPALGGTRPLGYAAAGVAAILAVASIGVSISATSDTAEAGDVEVLAKDVEYPETLTASAGLIGFHIKNDDLFYHSFVIDGQDVKVDLPGTKARRVEVQLAPGEYHFHCDVPGHESMEGTLTVQ